MKCFNIITLVASLMVTGCALGMDTEPDSHATIHLMQLKDIKKMVLDCTTVQNDKGELNAQLNKRSIGGQLKFLYDWLNKSKCQIDKKRKNMLHARINALKTVPAAPAVVPRPAAPVREPDANPRPGIESATPVPSKPVPTANPVGPEAVAQKVFSAKGILLHPFFIGAVALSTLASITYTYLAKKQTKKADAIDTDLDEDTLIS